MVDPKEKFNLLEPREAEVVEDRITLSKELLAKIDAIMKLDKRAREENLGQFTDTVQKNRGDRVIHSLNELDRCHI